MAQRISIRRIVGAVTGAGLIAGAVFFTLEHRRLDREFFAWTDARPLHVAADLSRPGTVTAPFNQTCQVSHGEAFYLTVEGPTDRSDVELLHGLEGTITIKDADGHEVQSLKMTSNIDSRAAADESIMLAYFHPFANGDYTATIVVKNGATALRGKTQTVYAKYLLCGLERFPATVSGFLALVCGIPGLIIGVIVTKGFVKHGWSTPPAKTTEASPAPETAVGSVANGTPDV
jgi:hypothetical protein